MARIVDGEKRNLVLLPHDAKQALDMGLVNCTAGDLEKEPSVGARMLNSLMALAPPESRTER